MSRDEALDGMQGLLLTLAALALVAGHLLRLPNRGGWLGNFAAFLVGLLLVCGLVRVGANAVGAGRVTPFDGFVNRAVLIAEQTDAPLVVFNGASFSRNAIDDERLTAATSERGYPHQMINISLEAASLMERDHYLSEFLKRSRRAPNIVFIEIAEMTDRRPTFIFNNSKFSTRAIAQFDLDASLWTATGLAGGGCLGLTDCVKESGLLGVHSMLNVLNVGLISQGKTLRNIAPSSSYDGAMVARQDIPVKEREQNLATILPTEPKEALNWARSFRSLQRERLLDNGVERVAYYFPPVLSPTERQYAANLCAGELAAYVCIAPEDPVLLSALTGEVWLDDAHLLDAGAAIYVNWLANQLVQRGVLDDEVALQ